ncbi:MAG: tellurite resistance TerB family protein [Hyphomicrobiaceae bacterium]|nr:tellurite resistance TerB family protein [Hyphomicrobiaceae bacterium]MCC0009553.1 tellurite resistance TerB family protein [Hyphomicrobiaceae bacterium]
MQTLLKPEQALIYAMIAVSAVDRSMSDAELKRIGAMVRELPVFGKYDDTWLVDEARECGALLAQEGGLRRVLDLVTAGLPEHLRETAYVLSAEVAISDRRIASEEIRFLDLLAEALSIDKLTCAALERAASARQQKQ